MSKTRVFKTTAAGACALMVLAQGAAANPSRPIDIPPQPLADALVQLSKETGLNVFASDRVIAGVQTAGARGPATPEQALATLLSGTSLSFAAFADGYTISTQGGEDAPVDLGTLVLTGERVERDVFSTASSVVAVSGDVIDRNPQDNDVESVFENVPNIVTATGNTAPSIRGVNSAGALSGGALGLISGSLPRTTVTVDGRNLSQNEFIYGSTSVFDTEAIEVFRGPQTTSQGANAIAGAINLRTRDPFFGQEAALRFEASSNNGRAASLMANTALSDSLALRFVFDAERQDMFFDYASNLDPAEEAESRYQSSTRLKLLWEPASLPSLSTKLTLSYSEFHAPQNQALRKPFDDLEAFGDIADPSAFRGDTRAVVHDISYDLGNGFELRNQFQYSDAQTRPIEGGGNGAFGSESIDRSNETILEYAPEGRPFSGIFGLYFRETEDETDGAGGELRGDRNGFGAFSEGTYDFGNGFDVTAGLRYQENVQTRFASLGNFTLLDFDETYSAVLPKLTLGYAASENTRYAFQISRGYNPGGGTINLVTLNAYEFEEETVTNYELSVRHRSPDGRLFVAANLFYNEYQDYQLFISRLVPPAPPFFSTQAGEVFNLEDVRTYGLEVEAEYFYNDFTLTGSLGLLQTSVGDLGDDIVAFTGGTNNDGNKLPQAPNVTLGIGVDYQVTDVFSIGGSVNYTGRYFTGINNEDSLKVGNFALVDIRTAYEMFDGIELYSYVNNLFDERAEINLFEDIGTGDIVGGSITEPREIGFGLRATF